MKRALFHLLAAACFLAGVSRASAETAEFPGYGFSIDTLSAKPATDRATQALMMFLPPAGGFAANVNIVIQPYTDGLKAYVDLSHQQITGLGAKVLTERTVGDSEWFIEYTGPFREHELHWYSRAIVAGGKVYLVTATALSSDWGASGEALRHTVDSLKLK